LLIPGGVGIGENGGGQPDCWGGQQGPAQEECQEGCKPAGHSRRLQQPQQDRLSAAHQGNSLQGVLSMFSLIILAL
jgi:hypothetical protein